MNRLKYLLLAFTAVVASCSLYLEEPEEIPEEQRGFGEDYHLVNDTVDVTYQFNDNVKVLSQRIQDNYLVMVEADSILYFSEYTPQQDLPAAGEGVFSDCTDKLPYGMCSKVLSVNRENGLVKVVTQTTDINTVFKRLVLNVDKVAKQSSARVDPNAPVPDSTFTVFDDVEQLSTPEARQYYYKMRRQSSPDWQAPWQTRGDGDGNEDASDDDDDEIESGKKDTDETFEWGFTFDTRYFDTLSDIGGSIDKFEMGKAFLKLPSVPKPVKKLIGKLGAKAKIFDITPAFFGKNSEVKWYLVGDISYKNTQYIHTCIDTDKDLIEYNTIDETVWEGGLEAGVSYAPGINKKEWYPGEWLSQKTIFKNKPDMVCEYEIDAPEIVIPIWGPLSLCLQTSFKIDISVEVCGKVRFIRTTRKVTGTKIYKGVITSIDRDETKKKNGLKEASIAGTAKLDLSLSAGVALRVGRGITFDIGGGGTITAGVEAKAYKNFMEEENYKEQKITNDNYINFYVKWNWFLGIRLKTFFITPLDEKIEFGQQDIVNEKFTLFPQIDDESEVVHAPEEETFTDDEFPKPIEAFWYTQKFRHVGIFVSLMDHSGMKPFVRLYEAKSKKLLNELLPEEGKTGYFEIKNDNDAVYHYHLEGLEDDVTYRLVPCMSWCGAIYEYPNEAQYFNSVTPYIAMTDIGGESSCYQVYGAYEPDEKETPYEYLVAAFPQVTGWSFIKKFGLRLKVYNNNNKCILNERLPINERNYNVFTVGISIHTSVKNPRIEVEPFAYVYKDGTSASLKYFEKEKHELKLSSSKGTLDDYNEFTSKMTSFLLPGMK